MRRWNISLAVFSALWMGNVCAQVPQGDTVLHTVGYSHLDTQWRWHYQTTIQEYIPNTLRQNFRLFEKYPDYTFNFTGANRYRMMKEYYSSEYDTLRMYVAKGRWVPCGSSMEENDVNVPSPESIVRQILYGNQYFRREFNTASCDYMLPDCFGFPASLPSILAHSGIKGFSTQKLTWGSAVGIPFTLGTWEGPDGRSVVAAFDPGSYVTEVKEDLSRSASWLGRIRLLAKQADLPAEYMYYGVGDRGGAPTEESVRWIEKSIAGTGPIRVKSSRADELFRLITPKQRSKLPTYKGDLLLTNHSAGSVTSAAAMKRWNRKNELMAFTAEGASVIADWLEGGLAYPGEKIREAWRLVLGAQFHDILPGTSIPKAYEYSWNDEMLAMNQFSGILTDAIGAVSGALDTRGRGIPLVVFNPLCAEREDVVEATLRYPAQPPRFVRVHGPDGVDVPSQIIRSEGNSLTVLILARVPPAGVATYDVRPSEVPPPGEVSTGLSGTDSSLENPRYLVRLNAEGDVSRILDKSAGRELLSGPARLAFLHERPKEYPAWNMDWEDREHPPAGYVEGPAQVRLIESGPVRVCLEVRRQSRGSTFVQRIRLAARGAADRVEFDTDIDWFTKESSLKVVFPLSVSNPVATYDLGAGAVERGNNNPKKFEVPSHQWFDVTDHDSTYGVSVLNDSKYGSDKPSDNEVRLTLLYTPGVRADFQDQATQDFGKHTMCYALLGHAGDWRKGRSFAQAARLNQPLRAFQTTHHQGFLGKTFSFATVSTPDVAVGAIKKAEETDEIILRLHEKSGRPLHDASLGMCSSILSAREVDGQEQPLGGTAGIRNGRLVFSMNPYEMRAFALKLSMPRKTLPRPVSRPVPLPYNRDVISWDRNKGDGSFGRSGASLPAELLPDTITSSGVSFVMGPKEDGRLNALACAGQTIDLPGKGWDRLYLLAAASERDTSGVFAVDGKPSVFSLPLWSGFIGQWDNRIWDGAVAESDPNYSWDNVDYLGLRPGYTKQNRVGFFATHRHSADGKNIPYSYAYLFVYELEIPGNARRLTVPLDSSVILMAVSAARNAPDLARPASPLSDTLNADPREYAKFRVWCVPSIFPERTLIEEGKPVTVRMETKDPHAEIRYTKDGSDPTAASGVYAGPFQLGATTVLKAAAFGGGAHPSRIVTARFYQAYPLRSVRYSTAWSAKYPGGGDSTLLDSRRGTISYADKAWQGFEQTDLDIVVDLGQVRTVKKVSLGCLSNNISWIFLPASVEIAVGEDQEHFRSAARVEYGAPKEDEGLFTKDLSISLENRAARYLHIVAKNIGQCPPWHPGAGGKAWLFVDELIVE